MIAPIQNGDAMFKRALALTALLTSTAACASQKPTVTAPLTPPPPVAAKPVWTCPTCTPVEQYVLKTIQENTRITDKNALATILGNIKQESMFISNICEGGARVEYPNCHRGGYGLIQWTTEARYLGLGSFCKKYDCDPSSLDGQVRYMINENQFQKVLPQFEGNGQSVAYYMQPAYRWLGWGIKGARETYAYNYTKQLIFQ